MLYSFFIEAECFFHAELLLVRWDSTVLYFETQSSFFLCYHWAGNGCFYVKVLFAAWQWKGAMFSLFHMFSLYVIIHCCCSSYFAYMLLVGCYPKVALLQTCLPAHTAIAVIAAIVANRCSKICYIASFLCNILYQRQFILRARLGKFYLVYA